jgi:arylsulfatase A-like enzyme
MKRRRFCRNATLGGLGLMLESSSLGASSGTAQPPNVVSVVVDDLGWRDVGYMGSTFYDTPHIDRLARESMTFTNAYAASPVCSPTRAALLTGKTPARLNVTDWIPGRGNAPDQKLQQVEDKNYLPLEETTIAEMLGGAGYATAHMGKWHLGGEGHLPTDQGFDVNVGGYEAGSPGRFDGYFSPYNNPQMEDGPDGEYLVDRLSQEAERFIGAHQSEPFYLQLWHYAVHLPLQAKKEMVEANRAQADTMSFSDAFSTREGLRHREVQSQPTYAAMVESVDESVGRLLRALDEHGLTENTIVLLTSDNGGLATLPARRNPPPTSNDPLRSGKGWPYEGGIRVPLAVRWPGVTEAGSTSDEPVSSIDFFPTVLELIDRQPRATVDGTSLMPLLTQEADALDREALHWHYPHYHGSEAHPSGAIRRGDDKLIEFFASNRLELYDLEADPAEENNLAQQQPEKALRLRRELKRWRDDVDAQMPVPNPTYAGEK